MCIILYLQCGIRTPSPNSGRHWDYGCFFCIIHQQHSFLYLNLLTKSLGCGSSTSREGSQQETYDYSLETLTSIACKLFGIIVRDAIMKQFQRQHLLHDVQCGFLIGRSCLANLLSVLYTINWLMDSGEDVYMCFVFSVSSSQPRKCLPSWQVG